MSFITIIASLLLIGGSIFVAIGFIRDPGIKVSQEGKEWARVFGPLFLLFGIILAAVPFETLSTGLRRPGVMKFVVMVVVFGFFLFRAWQKLISRAVMRIFEYLPQEKVSLLRKTRYVDGVPSIDLTMPALLPFKDRVKNQVKNWALDGNNIVIISFSVSVVIIGIGAGVAFLFLIPALGLIESSSFLKLLLIFLASLVSASLVLVIDDVIFINSDRSVPHSSIYNDVITLILPCIGIYGFINGTIDDNLPSLIDSGLDELLWK